MLKLAQLCARVFACVYDGERWVQGDVGIGRG